MSNGSNIWSFIVGMTHEALIPEDKYFFAMTPLQISSAQNFGERVATFLSGNLISQNMWIISLLRKASSWKQGRERETILLNQHPKWKSWSRRKFQAKSCEYTNRIWMNPTSLVPITPRWSATPVVLSQISLPYYHNINFINCPNSKTFLVNCRTHNLTVWISFLRISSGQWSWT